VAHSPLCALLDFTPAAAASSLQLLAPGLTAGLLPWSTPLQAAKSLGSTLRSFAPTIREITSVSQELKDPLEQVGAGPLLWKFLGEMDEEIKGLKI